MKFNVIVCDPPYGFSDKLKQSDVKRSADANYPTMTISSIKQMAVKNVCDPAGAVLCLWVPSSLLQDGLDIMREWGFKHKQTYIWVKSKKEHSIIKLITKVIPKQGWGTGVKYLLNNILSFGMGHLFRQCHEICLIGTMGKINSQLKNRSQRSVSFAENKFHSCKPEDLQNSLEIMFPNKNYLEIFGRRLRKNWTVIGNEVCNGEDINVSLSKLI